MLERIIRLSISNRLVTLALAAAILIAGTIAVTRTEVDIFPDLNAPVVTVMTEVPGYSPEEVEKNVTFPIESAVSGAAGVRRVTSSSSAGFSAVRIEMDWNVDELDARQTVSERLSSVTGELPAAAGAPTLGPQSSILGEMMIIGLRSKSLPVEELRDYADRVLSRRLQSLPGVAQVSVLGSGTRRYEIQLDPAAMQRYGLTLQQVTAALDRLNEDVGAGAVTIGGSRYLVSAELSSADPDVIASAVIDPDRQPALTIADVATVSPGIELPASGSASINGESGVLVTVTKQHGASTRILTDAVDELIAAEQRSAGDSMTFDTHLFRQNDFIRSSITNLQESLLEGAVFVAVILFIFLMNVRTAVISLVALPVSVIVTMLILGLLDIGINTMTLGGIAIAIGSLVDDAIVDVENVYRRLRDNAALPESKRMAVAEVVRHASTEVRMPILNSSLIIAASFIPLFFLSGMEGRMLIPLGVAFIVALAASTVVALTVTPALCVYLLGTRKALKHEGESRDPWLMRHLRSSYSRALSRVLTPGATRVMLTVTGILFAGALVLFFTMGRGFLPPFNEGSFTINVAAPAGTSLEQSDSVGHIAEELIGAVPGVVATARKTGRAELDEHSLPVSMSEIEVPYRVGNGVTRSSIADSLRRALARIPGCVVEIGQPVTHRLNAMMSGSAGQIVVKIFGTDLNVLTTLANSAKSMMSGIEGVVDVAVQQPSASPRLSIVPRPEMMAAYGVTQSEMADWITAAIRGLEVGQVRDRGYAYDLVVTLGHVHSSDIDPVEYLRDLPVDTRRGKVPLYQLADVTASSGADRIDRENVSRVMTVTANVDGRDVGSATEAVEFAVAERLTLPPGYSVTVGGQAESQRRSTRTLALASAGALLVIALLLYMEFGSWTQSWIILINLPLALIGGVLLLWLTYREVNIPAVIGFISLMGISTRNGMLLISRYNSLRDNGMSLGERVAAGSSERLMPIVMTALTSALALIPLALRGSQPGNEIQAPMAVVILGGLFSATLLNIFVVPAVYRLLSTRKSHDAIDKM